MDIPSIRGDPFAMGKPRLKRGKSDQEGRPAGEGYPHVKARMKRGDQAKLAKALDISEPYLSQVLSGKRGTTLGMELTMARYFKTTRDGLHRPADDPDVAEIIAKLGPEQRRRAARMLQGAFGDDNS